MAASTYMPDVVTEIAFVTAPTAPISSATWVDVSAYVEAQDAIPITRGRSDRYSECQPSSVSVTLDNRDGRFTPGNPSSPYYPNVKKGRMVRVSSTWPLTGSPVTYREVLAYIDEWPVVWPGGTDRMSTVRISATSRTGRLSAGAALRDIIGIEYLADNPVAYYTLGDPSGSTIAGNSSIYTQPSLAKTAQLTTTGASITFGNATGPGTDSLTAATFVPGGSGYYDLEASIAPQVASTTGLTFELWFSTTHTSIGIATMQVPGSSLGLSTDASGKVYGELYGNTVLTPTSYSDGLTHHAALVLTPTGVNTGQVKFYVDGSLIGTSSSSGFMYTDASGTLINTRACTMAIGSFLGGMYGVLAQAAYYETPLSATRIMQHYLAGSSGFSGESSDARITRLAGYAGIPAAEISTETGLSTALTNQDTTGQTPLALMQAVEMTENGVLFDGKDGSLVFHARSHRYNATSALTIDTATNDIEDDLSPTLDDFGLINDVTATRPNGGTVRALDSSSQTDYGIYHVDLSLLATTDSEVYDAANWRIYSSSTPQVRVPTVSVEVELLSSANITAVLGLEIGSLITLANLPSQAPATTMTFFVEGYSKVITDASHRITFNLSPSAGFVVWQLDSATYSLLDSTTRLAY